VLTPAQMEDRFENLDHRLDRIEQILPTLATKDDLQAFATKAEQTFATKDDLKAFATKDDLEAFATKDDLKAFATKDDLREAFERASRETRALFENVIDRIKILGEGRGKRAR
jgi:hypothetical protein